MKNKLRTESKRFCNLKRIFHLDHKLTQIKYHRKVHVWLIIIYITCILCLSLSILLYFCPMGSIYDKSIGFMKCRWIKDFFTFVIFPFWERIWINIAEFIDTYNIDILGVIFPTLLSGAVILINGKNRLVILQLITLKLYLPKAFRVLVPFIFSALLIFGIAAKNENRITSASLSFIALMLILFYILLYVIRFNNDNAYYLQEICGCIIKSQNKEKQKQKYLTYLLPSSKDSYNSVYHDVSILNYLLINTKISGFRTSVEQSAVKEEEILPLFKNILVPLTVQMIRTHEKEKSALLWEITTKLNNIHNMNTDFEMFIYCYVVLILKEYVIERDFLLHSTKDSWDKKIDTWLLDNQKCCHYKPTVLENAFFFDFKRTEETESFLDQINEINNLYIGELAERQLITLADYNIAFEKYVMNNVIVDYEYNFVKTSSDMTIKYIFEF